MMKNNAEVNNNFNNLSMWTGILMIHSLLYVSYKWVITCPLALV